MKKIFLLLFFTLMLSLYGSAQTDEIKGGFAARAYFANYQYQINESLMKDDFSKGMELEYNRKFNDFFSLAIPARMNTALLPINSSGETHSTVSSGIDALLTIYPFRNKRVVNPYVYGGYGLVGDDFFDSFRSSVPVGLGFNFYLGQNTFLTTKAGYRFGFEDLRNPLELAVGFLVTFDGSGEVTRKPKGLDTDGDGIRDSEDLCPTVAGLVGLNGCPDKDSDGVTDNDDHCPDVPGSSEYMGCPDTDGDGVPDDIDKCPEIKGTKASNGCPEIVEISDADGDGIEDGVDKCPDIAGSPAFGGCPDTDGDGLMDQEDKCPNIAGPMATFGCPDTDGDSIIDKEDKCPTISGLAANNGCPGVSEEDKATLEFAVSAVKFESASATLKSTSYEVLDKIVDIMNKYPDYKLAIGGHTDSIGSTEKNLSLSKKRAKACFDYLVSKGIKATRMSHTGYGESVPIATNMYEAGREQNRRVEFNLFIR